MVCESPYSSLLPGRSVSHIFVQGSDFRDVPLHSGQEVTHLRLQPGEEIRTPLVVLQFYNGDRGKGLVMLGIDVAIWGAYVAFESPILTP